MEHALRAAGRVVQRLELVEAFRGTDVVLGPGVRARNLGGRKAADSRSVRVTIGRYEGRS